MRVGLIINTRSGRTRSKRWVGAALASKALEVVAIDEVAALPEALSTLARREIELLAISGGDGTVQAVLSHLGSHSPFAVAPALAIVASGTTNMNAGDVGLRGRPARALDRLVGLAESTGAPPESMVRNTIRLEAWPDRPPLVGMFFGTAALYRAILFSRQTVEAVGARAGPASALTLAAILARRMFGRGKSDDLFHGDEMVVRFDQEPPEPGQRLLALVTTLDRLILGTHPFWATERGALRYSEVRYPPRRLAAAVYPFLSGRPDRLPSDDYRSRSADRISFEMSCPFTLDGELYDPLPRVPVTLSAGGPVTFVR